MMKEKLKHVLENTININNILMPDNFQGIYSAVSPEGKYIFWNYMYRTLILALVNARHEEQ